MLQLTSTIAAELREVCCHEVNRSVAPLLRRNLNEPVLVASLNQSTVRYATAWRKILSREFPDIALSAAAVFTHQTPRVTWKTGSTSHVASKTCELADQLIAIIDRRNQTEDVPAVGRAMLLQVKKSEDGVAEIKTPGDLSQLQLLSERPLFSVTSPASGPKDIDIKQLEPDSALFYAMVGRGYPYQCYECCHPYQQWNVRDGLSQFANPSSNTIPIESSASFAAVVVGMLQGVYGWEFKLFPDDQASNYYADKRRNDWSRLINFLLRTTFSKDLAKSIREGLRIKSGQRGNETHLSFLASYDDSRIAVDGLPMLLVSTSEQPGSESVGSFKLRGGDGDDPPDIPGNNEYHDGPISAILIEIGSNDERRF
jgi:hypothetical protein